jgi:DNA-binding CsgD family transcriptional regulator
MIFVTNAAMHEADAAALFMPMPEHHTSRHNAHAAAPLPLLPLLQDGSSERLTLTTSLNAIATATTLDEVKAQTRRALSLFLPCEHFIFTRGWVKADRLTVLHLAYANSISRDYLDGIVGESNRDTPPLSLDLIRECGRPKFISIDRLEKSVDPGRADVFRKHGISNIAWIVLPGMRHDTFTGYFFQNISPAVRGDIKLRLTMLAPYVHIAVSRVFDLKQVKPQGLDEKDLNPFKATLSSREAEISRWVACGKTNWEIGQILGISDKTVKTHVQNILFKLRASSRAQVAALFSSQ